MQLQNTYFKKNDKERLVIRFQSPKDKSVVVTLDAKIVYEKLNSDMAFLQVPLINNQPCNAGDLYIFPLVPNSEYFSPGDDVLVIGYPLLTTALIELDIPVMRGGIVSSKDISLDKNKMLTLDLFGVPGFSGSPVILKDTGYVIGIIYGPGPTERGFGFEWATPIMKEDITSKDYLKALESGAVPR